MKTNEQKLQKALESIKTIQELIVRIYEESPLPFKGNKDLCKAYHDVTEKLDRSIERLKHPVLSIAAIGTTTSGKSTIINALTGRTIAPMKIEETSAGTLRLLPDSKISMTVAKSAHWKSGTFDPITDQKAYEKIENIFRRYFSSEKITSPPDITVRGPLLWSTHPELIGLPSNVTLEFIDLPGLKTLTDEKNMNVIKKHLSGSLCLVAMDYNDVDSTRIRRLLEELESIVKALGGNDKSILFLLNKVDAHGQDNVPLRTRIETLSSEIRSHLSLKADTEIKIIPFIARLLYYAQSALGDAVLEDNSEINYEQIGKLLIDHGILLWTSEKTEIRNAVGRVRECYNFKKDEVDDIKTTMTSTPNREDVAALIQECYRLSHAEILLEELKKRISDSFETVIIQPAVLETFKSLAAFRSKMQTYINVNKNSNYVSLLNEKLGLLKKKIQFVGCSEKREGKKISDDAWKEYNEELKLLRQQISKLPNDEKSKKKPFLLNAVEELQAQIDSRPAGKIEERLKAIEGETRTVTKKLIELNSGDSQFYAAATKFLTSVRDKSSVGIFSSVIDVPRNIKEKLNVQILHKIKEGFDLNKDQTYLQERLLENLPMHLVEPILDSYERTKKTFEFWNRDSSYLKEEYQYLYISKYEIPHEKLRATEKMYWAINARVREILYKKTNLLFQLESNAFVDGLKDFLQTEISSIINILHDNLGDGEIDLAKYIEDSFNNIEEPEVQLADNLFEFSKPDFAPDVALSKKWRQEGTETYEEGVCCPVTKTKTKWKMVDESTYTYPFPNAAGLYKKWQNGTTQSETLFWMVLADWIDATVQKYLSLLASISVESINEINTMISNRTREMQDVNCRTENKLEHLKTLLDHLEQLMSSFNKR